MDADKIVDVLRRFERVYENHLRKVRRAVANEDFTVTDIRVICELGFLKGGGSGAWLAFRVDVDAGYMCRVLKKLQAYGLVVAYASTSDRRMRNWELTRAGEEFATSIEAEHRERSSVMVYDLQPDERRQLVDATRALEKLLARAAMSF